VVQLTRLGGPVFALNPDLIERAEATPDTVVTLVNGSRYVIRESLEELAELISAYRAAVVAQAQIVADQAIAASRGTPPRGNVVALHHPGER
jgi:flagellar protein FlbD